MGGLTDEVGLHGAANADLIYEIRLTQALLGESSEFGPSWPFLDCFVAVSVHFSSRATSTARFLIHQTRRLAK